MNLSYFYYILGGLHQIFLVYHCIDRKKRVKIMNQLREDTTKDSPIVKEIAESASSNAQKKREKLLSEKNIPILVISFIIPTIVGMLVNAIYNVVDRFWIGKMSDSAAAMAGVGVTLPLTTIAFSFMVLVGIGSTALISLKLGERKKEDAEKVLGNCASLSFISGFVILLLGLFTAEPLLRLFGASDNTMPFARDYVYVLLFFNVINSIQFSMSSVMRGVGHPMWSVFTQATGAIVNIILDPFFIFDAGIIRVFGFEINMPFGLGLGVKGAALATGIAQTISFAICLFYYLSKRSPVHLRRKYLRPNLPIAKRIFAIGMSSFALQCAASAVQAVSNFQLRSFGGDNALTAITIVNSVAMFCIMPLIGINQGIQPIIGFNYGARNFRRVRKTFFFAVGISSAMTITAFVFIWLFPTHIVRFFSEDSTVAPIAANALRWVLLVLPVLGFQIVSANYFQFVGKSFVALIMTLLRQIILLIPLYLILPMFFGLDGIWFASPIADGVSVVITTIVITRELILLTKKIRVEEGNPSTLSAHAG